MVRREHGLVLVVGLVILLILTLISVTAMRGTSLEEHMAGNMQFRNQAFQLAEAALREGELQIRNGPPAPGTNGYCSQPLDPPPDPANPRWITFYGVGVSPPTSSAGECKPVCASFGCSDGTSDGASYLIEKTIAAPTNLNNPANAQSNVYYRITAEGVGRDGKTVAVLQSTYKL